MMVYPAQTRVDADPRFRVRLPYPPHTIIPPGGQRVIPTAEIQRAILDGDLQTDPPEAKKPRAKKTTSKKSEG